jgi:hypothetical protein
MPEMTFDVRINGRRSGRATGAKMVQDLFMALTRRIV